MGLLLPGSSVVSRFVGGTGQPLQAGVTWSAGLGALTHIAGPSDQDLVVQAPASRALVLGANAGDVLTVDGAFVDMASPDIRLGTLLGAAATVARATTLHTTNSGTGTETLSGIIPAGAQVLAVVARVVTVLAGTGLTTWTMGDGGDADRYGTGLAVAADTTVDHTDWTADPEGAWSAAARDIIITADAGQFDSGQVRVTVFYVASIAPTS